jgi:hypothetical protein
MGEFQNTGPGFNEIGRKEGKMSHILSNAEFNAYSSPSKVFQSPFDGKFGNTAWIDSHPQSQKMKPEIFNG